MALTRDKQFAAIVQTGAILQEMTSRFSGKTEKAFANVDALDVVGWAVSLPEYCLPPDVTKAAREFLDWCYDTGPKPEWAPVQVGSVDTIHLMPWGPRR